MLAWFQLPAIFAVSRACTVLAVDVSLPPLIQTYRHMIFSTLPMSRPLSSCEAIRFYPNLWSDFIKSNWPRIVSPWNQDIWAHLCLIQNSAWTYIHFHGQCRIKHGAYLRLFSSLFEALWGAQINRSLSSPEFMANQNRCKRFTW